MPATVLICLEVLKAWLPKMKITFILMLVKNTFLFSIREL